MAVSCSLVLQMNRVPDGSPFITAAGIAEVPRAAEAAGFDSVVTNCAVNLPGRTPAEQADLAARFGEDVIARL